MHGLPGETAPEAHASAPRASPCWAPRSLRSGSRSPLPADPLQLFLWALTLSAATSFPVLLLSIWSKRVNAWGALADMSTGLAVTIFMMLLGEAGAVTLPSALAGAVGLPLALAAALVASRMTPAPGSSVLDTVREMRVPGGETLYDREMRLLRLKNRTQT